VKRAWFATVTIAFALGGCLFYPDIGELSGSGSPTVDGGVDAPGDSPSPADAKADAGRFCTSAPHAFCADFDQGALADGWDDTYQDFNSTLVLSTKRALSAPGSASITMPRRESGASAAYATLIKRFTGWKRIVIDFDAYIEAPTFLSGDVNSGMLTIESYSEPNQNVGIAVSVGEVYTTVGNPGTASNGAPLSWDRWFHVHFDVTPTKSFSAVIDGQAFAGTWSATMGTDPKTIIGIGVAGYNKPAPEFRFYYDNVTIDFP
jgi:hypothetical protein